jgi:methionyl aminopeptidase
MDNLEFDSYVKAGKIARGVKNFALGFIKPNMKLIDIAEKIDAKILELGGEMAFPVNLSLNEIAAHFTPGLDCKIVAKGILKVDIGVVVDGFIADTAFSVDLTEDKEYEKMIKLNKEILKNASEVIRDGMEVCDVGSAVQKTLEEWNIENDSSFSVIKSLSGHALEKDMIHAGLTISNYRNDNRTILDDDAFAIEPFVTTGVGDIYEGGVGGIYVLQSDTNVRDRDAREVLKFIKENYKTRPFCVRWLEKAGFKKLKFVLGVLVKQGLLYEYPILIEKSHAVVSQFENTFIVANGKVVCTTG